MCKPESLCPPPPPGPPPRKLLQVVNKEKELRKESRRERERRWCPRGARAVLQHPAAVRCASSTKHYLWPLGISLPLHFLLWETRTIMWIYIMHVKSTWFI